MKNYISTIIFTLAFIVSGSITAAAQAKLETVKIKTSAECDMCKAKIEKEVGLTKGVKKATLDITTRELTVIYNPSKTTVAKIKTVISNAGYDADEVKANNRAQKKLPDCCQPGAGNGKCDTVK
ncbi:MAG: cation transporter [Bacteroidia bacterium]|nr:cation transporter [Bacteroidia bacterium]